MEKTLKCRSCSQEKAISEFYFRKETGKYKTQCKRCCIDQKKIPKDPEKKLCKHCNELKPFSEFQKAGGGKWFQPYCKPCDSERKKKHRRENYEKCQQKGKEYYEKNKASISAREKEERRIARANRPKRVFKRMPEQEKKRRKSEQDKKYRAKKGEELLQKKRAYSRGRGLELKKKWQKEKMKDIGFRIVKNLRSRVYVALKRDIKTEATMQLLGCSIDSFKNYFQSLFIEGMTWEKYLAGEIVIDHKKPCILFDLKIPEQQRQCFHYSNLQPLWKLDNLKKGTKYEEYAGRNHTAHKMPLSG